MCMEAFPFGRDIYLFQPGRLTAPSPTGRCSSRCLRRSTSWAVPTSQRWYMINLHPALSRQGELVFSTSNDPANFWVNFNRVGSADFYRLLLPRMPTGEHVYDSDDDSGTGTENSDHALRSPPERVHPVEKRTP